MPDTPRHRACCPTGIVERPSVMKNLKVVLRPQPRLEHVVMTRII